MNTQTSKRGFTIIEVVLVLAIAALIFLMIFIALPALQKGQRDTARKNDANAVAAAIGTYRSNNRGEMPDPGDLETFANDYVKSLSQYSPSDITEGDNPETTAEMKIEFGVTCEGDASGRAAAIRVKLESAPDTAAPFCADA